MNCRVNQFRGFIHQIRSEVLWLRYIAIIPRGGVEVFIHKLPDKLTASGQGGGGPFDNPGAEGDDRELRGSQPDCHWQCLSHRQHKGRPEAGFRRAVALLVQWSFGWPFFCSLEAGASALSTPLGNLLRRLSIGFRLQMLFKSLWKCASLTVLLLAR